METQPVSPFYFGPKILEILGIPNENVKELHIHVVPTEYVHVDVKLTLSLDKAEALVDAMKTYTLTETCKEPKE